MDFLNLLSIKHTMPIRAKESCSFLNNFFNITTFLKCSWYSNQNLYTTLFNLTVFDQWNFENKYFGKFISYFRITWSVMLLYVLKYYYFTTNVKTAFSINIFSITMILTMHFIQKINKQESFSSVYVKLFITVFQ